MRNALRFTFVIQVYGGAISMIIGPYVWSELVTGVAGGLNATSGDTYCSNCGVSMSEISIFDSGARSITSGDGACSSPSVSLSDQFFFFGI